MPLKDTESHHIHIYSMYTNEYNTSSVSVCWQNTAARFLTNNQLSTHLKQRNINLAKESYPISNLTSRT